MRKQAVILMAVVVLAFGGCALAGGGLESGAEDPTAVNTTENSEKELGDTAANTEENTAEDNGQESTAMPSEESGSVSSEEASSGAVKLEVPKVEIDYDHLIDERTALDLAYNYLYEDSEYNEYSVYCDEIWHQGVQRWGYVVVQFAYDEGDYTRRYEKYDPNANLMIGREGRIELLYDGLSGNELFYTFWLCGYIRDDEDWGHRSTFNFIAVSIDGKMIECERSDEQGNEKSIDEWDWYYELITQ